MMVDGGRVVLERPADSDSDSDYMDDGDGDGDSDRDDDFGDSGSATAAATAIVTATSALLVNEKGVRGQRPAVSAGVQTAGASTYASCWTSYLPV
jgi:hypothetical protein